MGMNYKFPSEITCFLDHPEGQNKFQDWYKSDIYVIVDSHKEEPNVYCIQPLDTTQKVKPKVVNQWELYNLKRSPPQSKSQDSDTVDDQIPQIVQFILDKILRGDGRTFSPFTHPYNTRLKNKTATVCRQAVVEIQVTHL